MTDSRRWMLFVTIIIAAWIVYFLSPILIPFVFSFLLAYFLDPAVRWLTKLHIHRILAAFIVFIVLVVIVTFVLILVIPPLEAQIVSLINKVPSLLDWANKVAIPWVSQTFGSSANLADNIATLKANIMQNLHSSGGLIKTVFGIISRSTHAILEFMLNLVMIPVVTLYLLCDWRKVTQKGQAYIPLSENNRHTAVVLIKECGDMLAGFIRGQLLVMIGMGIVYSVGLWIVGLDLALLIGILSGLFTVVPYLGFFSGLIAALIAAFFQYHDWIHIVGVLIVYGIGVCLENFVFSPWFVGDRIGLHPVAVIFAVLAGGKLFGFVGVLLALPAAAVVMVFFRHLCRSYFPSDELPHEQIEEKT